MKIWCIIKYSGKNTLVAVPIRTKVRDGIDLAMSIAVP